MLANNLFDGIKKINGLINISPLISTNRNTKWNDENQKYDYISHSCCTGPGYMHIYDDNIANIAKDTNMNLWGEYEYKNLPPTYINGGLREVMIDEITKFGNNLKKYGLNDEKKYKFETYDDVHDFTAFFYWKKTSKDSVQSIIKFIDDNKTSNITNITSDQ